MHSKSSYHLLAVASLIGSLTATEAAALSTNIYDFTVVRNGTTFFQDTFSDGLQPPQSPAQPPSGLVGCGTQCYIVSGTFSNGSESGGRLGIDSNFGVQNTNAAGTLVSTQRGTLSLNTNPAPFQGLQRASTYQVSGRFDFVEPNAGDTFSVALADRDTGHTISDLVQVQVAGLASGGAQIRFREQNFDTHTIAQFDSDFVSSANGDQVRLFLSHPTANTDTIFAGYEFFKQGISQGIVQLGGSTSIYDGEIWTRPEFSIAHTVVAAIPEPEIYTMMLVGLGLVGWVAKRRCRDSERN